jgi:hypothetical protein
MEQALILGLIYFAAGLIQGLTGFAFAVLSVPILSVMYNPVQAVAMTAVIGPPVLIYNWWLHRSHAEPRRIIRLLVITLVFVPVGIFFLYRAPEAIIMTALGAIVILLTLFSAFAADRVTAALRKPGVGFGVGSVSGVLSGAFTTPGPTIVAYLYNTDPSRMRAKANTQIVFTALSIVVLAIHASSGVVNGAIALRVLPSVPVALLAMKLGAYLSGRLPVHIFRIVTDSCLVALGGYLILSNV